jgi:hypothetical protein
MAAVHCGTFDVKHFQTKDVQVSLRTIRQTMLGICSQISKTKHRSGISQLMIFGFRRFQFREFLGPKICQDSFDPQTCQAGTFTHFACMSACCVSES